MYYQPPPASNIPPSQQPQQQNPQQMMANRGGAPPPPQMRPGPTLAPSNVSPNVVAQPSPAQPQFGPQFSVHDPNSFSPFSPQHQGLYPLSQQQMLTPLSQQQQPPSNAPATPATPQQQHTQPSSVHHLQPGSAQPQSMHHLGGSQHSIGSVGPGSVGPTSVGPPSQQQMQPRMDAAVVHQQTANASAPLTSQPFPRNETDPIAAAKALILRDLRKAVMDINLMADRVADRHLAQINTAIASSAQHDDKKLPILPGGPHSNIGTAGAVGGPHSNLGGPHSNMNPLSVQNPQSVQNPHSVRSAGGDEQTTAGGGAAGKDGVSGGDGVSAAGSNNPVEQYAHARNYFLNICDDIERNLHLISEVYRQHTKLDAVCSVRIPADLNSPGSTLPNLIQPYVDTMNNDRRVLQQSIDEVGALAERIRRATEGQETEDVAANLGRMPKQLMEVD